VADNGPGIPPDELERVFVPFRRLPRHRDRPGSGLGLYFAKTLVEQQGGRIWAESKPGQGAKFYVRLRRGGERKTQGS
jgi:signal transduction histidine kinase